ncbi:NAD-dependent epimerase/dehydratase family protein [Aquibaculum arenosum]|uniref:NAD(P)-dependent oxidoreductase n=1 Tax=Aquibaculum arenosum TaxID=3032591 RepID=A0ABT5YQ37_9PROT|nr:NAD(P)-dependent oxidoreductase [Fodinicurvata sp. CAU 1616]MDF2097085.1 NAD(P)-dependent oxidoreductase [Fodinicurvata sp. CAU 1616]
MTAILITGAAGFLGQHLAQHFADKAERLVLSDIKPLPEEPAGAERVQADLGDKQAVLEMAREVDAILHFGGLPVEYPFEEILHANLRGSYHVFEAARASGARVIFASSNHAIGYYERSQRLDVADPPMPDGFYGLSKAYVELLARTYWMKHGVESASLRIGSALPEPRDARNLSTWFALPDMMAMIEACLAAQPLGCRLLWGASANSRGWWGRDDRDGLDLPPFDDAERFAAALEAKVTDDPVNERYQGGSFASDGYDRAEPAPPPPLRR